MTRLALIPPQVDFTCSPVPALHKVKAARNAVQGFASLDLMVSPSLENDAKVNIETEKHKLKQS
ncbi:hypothetical protein [Polaromonas glacialis]|uniref:hypothetical protein n=1 Tax=Polaromonas glacialis TaxID=866564 RepID=UPI0012EB1152|nr:hypothetical protein [Polaromonas glacialis]